MNNMIKSVTIIFIIIIIIIIITIIIITMIIIKIAPVSTNLLLLSGRSAVDKVPSTFRSITSNRLRTALEDG